MALTTGINQVYSSTYRNLPQKALPLGTPSAVYESVMPYDTKAANTFVSYFEYIMPIGFGWATTTNYDVLNIGLVGGNAPNFGNQIVNPGYRLRKVTIQCSGNSGLATGCYIGFATANNLFNPNANTSAYLGTANTTGVIAGTLVGGVPGTPSTFLASANLGTSDDVPSSASWGVVINTPSLNAQDTLILCPAAVAQQTTTLVTLKGRVEFYLTGPTGY